MLEHLARLQGKRHARHDGASASFLDRAGTEIVAQVGEEPGVRGVRRSLPGDLVHEDLARALFAAQRPQHVQTHHVGRALPDGVEGGLTVEPRDRILHDEPVSAVHLQRFVHEIDGTLTIPVFDDRRCNARKQALALVQLHAIGGLRDPQRRQHRRFAFQRQIGQHVRLHRQIGHPLPEAVARRCVADRQGQRLAHQPGRADGEVEPREMRMRQDFPDAAPLLADQHRPGPVEFHFARCVGTISALVLQTLHQNAVETAIRQKTRNEKAADAGYRPGQRVEAVGRGHREEPFVAGDAIDLRAVLAAEKGGGGLHLAQIGAALLLGHRIADHGAGFLGQRQSARVVRTRQSFLPPQRELRTAGETGARRVGHPGWTARAVFNLVPEIAQHGPGEVAGRLPCRPGETGNAVTECQAHELMPGRVKFDPVETIAEAIMRAKLRTMLVRQPREILNLLVAGERTKTCLLYTSRCV